MDAKPNDIIPASEDSPRRSVRAAYARRMSAEKIRQVEADLNEEDRYDMSTEQSLFREYIASLVDMERRVLEKNPGREDMVLPLRQEQAKAIQDFAKTNELIRRTETAGSVFTTDKVAALIDKVASLVMYHVSDLTERQRVLSDINDLATAFRRASAEGTLLTPDQDAVMMDDTVPKPSSVATSGGALEGPAPFSDTVENVIDAALEDDPSDLDDDLDIGDLN